MTTPQLNDQQRAAILMSTVTQILTGAPGMEAALDQHLTLMIGNRVHDQNLLAWAGHVQAGGRPILHISFGPDRPIPVFSLVSVAGSQVCAIEDCLLWAPGKGSGAWLIPQINGLGAYRLNADLTLAHYERAPVLGRRAEKGYVRAYGQFFDLLPKISATVGALPLPVLGQMQAA